MDHNRVIVHIDIDCFYAQVEMIRDPSLRDKPLGIQQKNIIVTCNYEARRRGATKLMFLSEAKKKCPDLVIVNGEDLTHYRQMSYQISDYIQRYSPCVERLGFDENFVDVTDIAKTRLKNGDFKKQFIGHVYDDKEIAQDAFLNLPCTCGCELQLQVGSQIAADIREGLEHDLSITCCAGVAHNKLLAKLVGSVNKPNQQTSLLPHLACQMMSSLPGVRAIPGIGSKMAKRLNALRIDSVCDLRQSEPSLLGQEFGEGTASTLLKLAVGVDDSPVVTFGLPQTLSDEDSFKCCNQISDAESRIKMFLGSLLERLKEDGRIPQTLRLTLRRTNYHRESRQCSLQQGIFTKFYKSDDVKTTQQQLTSIAMKLFSKMVKDGDSFHLTLINVCFAKLVEKPPQNQLSSFFTRHTKPQSQHCMETDESNVMTITLDSKLDSSEELLQQKESEEEYPSWKVKPQSLSKDSSAMIPQATSSNSTDSSYPPPTPETLSCDETPKSKGNLIYSSQPNTKESLTKLLPPHLDVQTVLELPSVIQEEILSQHGIHLHRSPSGDKYFPSEEAGILTRSKTTNSRKPLFSPKKEKEKRTRQGAQGGESHHGKLCRLVPTCSDLRPQQTSPDVVQDINARFHAVESSIIVDEKCDNVSFVNRCYKQPVVSQHCHDLAALCTDHRHNSLFSDQLLNSDGTPSESKDTSEMCYSDSSTLTTRDYLSTSSRILEDSASVPKKRDNLMLCETVDSHIFSGEDYYTTSGDQEANLHVKSFAPGTSGMRTSKPENTDPCRARRSSGSLPTGLSKPKSSQCPEGMDPDVFSALPSNIKGEILAHASMGSEHVFFNRSITQTSANPHVGEKKKKGQKTLLSFFQKT